MKKQENLFQQYPLDNTILEALTLLGYKEPTQIQEQVLPLALKRKDIVAKSQTGSGKTAAFAIPICQFAEWEENAPQALVLEPTRELAVQVKQEIFHIGRKKRLKVADVFGGFPIEKQIQTLRQKNHVVVGTPGRVIDHIRRESFAISKIKTIVIDEADLMLDMGFMEEVEQILKMLPKQHTTMLFSATMGEALQAMIQRYMVEPEKLILEMETETAAGLLQNIVMTQEEEKYEVFRDILVKANPDSCMIFCGTREMVNVLCRRLRKDGVKCGMLHGEIEQQDRLRTIENFREGRFRYLIATDVAARGIDFQNLSHVLQYDFPTGREAYVHRAGRTGRNGQQGHVISMVCERDKKMLSMVEAYIHMNLEEMQRVIPTQEEERTFQNRQKEKPILNEKKGAAFQKTIMKLSIGGGKKSKMRAVDIVGTICNIEGVEAEDVGIIDVRESLSYVEILNGKGREVLEALQTKAIKGKVRKVRITKG